jgi:hypothetical protein
MKRRFGAKPAESFTRLKYWIAASPKREGALLGLEQKLTSIANDRCLRITRVFRRDLTHFECSSWTHHRTPKHFSTFCQFLDAIVPEETP